MGGGRSRRPATPPPGAASIAWVPQRPTLFRGTVADNIRLGDAAADDAGVLRGGAARRAPTTSSPRSRTATRRSSATAAARSRPASSGGSRSPAPSSATRRSSSSTSRPPTSTPRAPSSSREAVDRLRVGRTVLLIAHRPELAALADRVVAVEAGRVVEPAGGSGVTSTVRRLLALSPTCRAGVWLWRSGSARSRSPSAWRCSRPPGT